MLNLILIIVIGLYAFYFFTRKGKIDIGETATKRLRILNLGLLVILVGLLIFSNYNIHLRGYWTTKILIWIFIFSSMTQFAFGHRQSQMIFERIYYGLFFYFPLACIPLSFMYYFGWGILLGIYEHTIGEQIDIIYSNNKYRIEQTYQAPIASAPVLFLKRGLIEYKSTPLETDELINQDYINKTDSIKIIEIADMKFKIIIYPNEHFKDENSNNNYPIEINADFQK